MSHFLEQSWIFRLFSERVLLKICLFIIKRSRLILMLYLSFFFLGRKPADLQNLAPGTHPPFITFNGEVRTDVNKIEEFLEDVLSPPKLVKACVYVLKCPMSVNTTSKCFIWHMCAFVHPGTLNLVPDTQNPTLQGWIYLPSSLPSSRIPSLTPMRVTRKILLFHFQTDLA